MPGKTLNVFWEINTLTLSARVCLYFAWNKVSIFHNMLFLKAQWARHAIWKYDLGSFRYILKRQNRGVLFFNDDVKRTTLQISVYYKLVITCRAQCKRPSLLLRAIAIHLHEEEKKKHCGFFFFLRRSI